MGSSFHVWDADSWYYARIGQALLESRWDSAFTMHVPPLFGWVLSIIGPWKNPGIIVLQAACLVLAATALLRLGRVLGASTAWSAALMLLFSHSVERYGLQGLPDAPFLALHLWLLGELTSAVPRLSRILPSILALALLRFDTLLFIPLYAVFPSVMAGRISRPGLRQVGISALIVVLLMTAWTHVRHGVWAPSPRFALLYPQVGEDQLLESRTTLWREMAAEGRPAPLISPTDQLKASQVGARETQNQRLSGLPSVFLWQIRSLGDSGQLGLLGSALVLSAMLISPLSRRLALMAGAFTLVYAFLGPRERYLSFAIPLWLLAGSLVLPRLARWGPWVLLCWGLLQVREGAYHIRHPENQPLELKMAADWIADEDMVRPARPGAILSREGSVAYHARRDWWRLPTGTRDEILSLVRRGGIAYIVADSRFLRSKRPLQTWLLDPEQVPWPCVKTIAFGEGPQEHVVRIYEVEQAGISGEGG